MYRKNTKSIEEILKFAKERHHEKDVYLSESEASKLLNNLPTDKIKKIYQIINVISLKASSENIRNSSDLIGERISFPSNEIIIPYDYFPKNIEVFEINNIIAEIADEFGVINSIRFLGDSVSVRFPLYNNNGFKNLEKVLSLEYSDSLTSYSNPGANRLQSIHLVTESIVLKNVLFLVLDEHFEMPIRCEIKNNDGKDAYIEKLHNIAYIVDAPKKKVSYNKNLADCINNGLFRKRLIARYMKTNNFKKPTLVQKSKDANILVLKNEIVIKTALINSIPLQYQSLYIDKTK